MLKSCNQKDINKFLEQVLRKEALNILTITAYTLLRVSQIGSNWQLTLNLLG